VRALFDSNVLIDYLNEIAAAKVEYELYESRAISIITWMEVLAGATAESRLATQVFLDSFAVIGISNKVAQRAVQIRAEKRLKLPDAIILATALEHALLLVTRNTKDFSANSPSVRIPY
jgi:predicted nucleic acid-binding protein